MSAENIDDLFRDKLDGHSTPPGDALWARLQAGPHADPAPDADAERLDQLFRQGLNAHTTPPSRELWERLEDEHLRPRQRRAAAWWPMALAAALALLLVAGGAGLWLGFPSGKTQTGSVASQKPQEKAAPVINQPNIMGTENIAPATSAPSTGNLAAASPQPAPSSSPALTQKYIAPQATRSEALASSAPKAKMSAPGQSPRRLKGSTRQPDAATDQLPLVARTTTRAASRPTAADEQQPATATAPVVAALPKPAPAPEIVPAAPASILASAGELITVDVRNGGEPVVRPSKMASLASTAEAAEDRPVWAADS
ncbi:hypothetical protein ACFQT0_16670 [Hymenobacter humi]|uniref:Uncharacterized protein n=1 Tax=Hymenobacter humi TaxID=1411620 RepID=A0ABW2U7L4_9BACT